MISSKDDYDPAIPRGQDSSDEAIVGVVSAIRSRAYAGTAFIAEEKPLSLPIRFLTAFGSRRHQGENRATVDMSTNRTDMSTYQIRRIVDPQSRKAITRRFMTSWSRDDIPSQVGKVAVVTGTGGLGYETALALAAAGAEVILAGRNADKGNESVRSILQQVPKAKIDFEVIDLASLASIEAFANTLLNRNCRIDLLVNNAGVMTPPTRKTTADGFELQFGTNHLGHFALAGRLLPLLRGHLARVVTVSSITHRLGGEIHFDDLQWTRKYSPGAAYSQSKLANLLFTFELQRRSDANGWDLMSNGAHPGASTTDLIFNGAGVETMPTRFKTTLVKLIGHPPAAGALPTLFAATSPDATLVGYYGPSGLFELKGPVGPSVISPKVKDVVLARRLWEVSEELTGVSWPPSKEDLATSRGEHGIAVRPRSSRH